MPPVAPEVGKGEVDALPQMTRGNLDIPHRDHHPLFTAVDTPASDHPVDLDEHFGESRDAVEEGALPSEDA